MNHDDNSDSFRRSSVAGSVLVGLIIALLAGSAEADGCHEVGVLVTSTGKIQFDGADYDCATGYTAICDCKPDAGNFALNLKVCNATAEGAKAWYKTNVLPLIVNNFKDAMKPPGFSDVTSKATIWAAYNHNETMYKKLGCKLNSQKTAKEAFCNKEIIYAANGIQSCTGVASDTTCSATSNCVTIEDKLYEYCDSVFGGPATMYLLLGGCCATC